ncbi:MAG: TIR domain-containing protein, partial [bacterium]|nr:TIR domain-containing protein [bacterium]
MASPSLFVSYSHHDTEALEQLRRFLRPLERDQQIAWWDDSRIEKGRDWAAEIAQALDDATAAVLLISQDFIDSEFITG